MQPRGVPGLKSPGEHGSSHPDSQPRGARRLRAQGSKGVPELTAQGEHRDQSLGVHESPQICSPGEHEDSEPWGAWEHISSQPRGIIRTQGDISHPGEHGSPQTHRPGEHVDSVMGCTGAPRLAAQGNTRIRALTMGAPKLAAQGSKGAPELTAQGVHGDQGLGEHGSEPPDSQLKGAPRSEPWGPPELACQPREPARCPEATWGGRNPGSAARGPGRACASRAPARRKWGAPVQQRGECGISRPARLSAAPRSPRAEPRAGAGRGWTAARGAWCWGLGTRGPRVALPAKQAAVVLLHSPRFILLINFIHLFFIVFILGGGRATPLRGSEFRNRPRQALGGC